MVFPVRAANSNATVTLYYPYTTINTAGVVRTLKITNPLGNLGITEVDINVPSAAATSVTVPTFGAGWVNAGVASVAGSGPWTIVFPGSSSTAVILPAGAGAKLWFTFHSETAEGTTATVDAYTFTVVIHFTDGSTQSALETMREGRVASVDVTTTTVSPVVAGHTIAYTATLNAADSGLPLTFISDPTVANVVADTFAASFTPATATTGSSTTVSTTFSSTESSAQALVDIATTACTDASCNYYALADAAASHGSSDANGFLTTTYAGAAPVSPVAGAITVNPSTPTSVKIGLPALDHSGKAITYVAQSTNVALTLTLADQYSNSIAAGVTGTAKLTALAGTLNCFGNCAAEVVTNGVFANPENYQAVTSTAALLKYGTFDLISASLTVTAPAQLAGTYAGSSKQLSIGYLDTGAMPPNLVITRYTPSVGGTAAAGAGTAVAGSKVGLEEDLQVAQAGVPVNFTLTSTDSSTAYKGTFSNMLSWMVVNTNSHGVAAVNFTADTTGTTAAAGCVPGGTDHCATGLAIVSEPITTAPTQTASSNPTAAIQTIASSGTALKISTYSDTALTNPTSYVKPSGHLYLNIKLQDQYGNSVNWNNAFALQITIASTGGGLSATTVYITSANANTFASGYQVQFTAPATLGDVTLSVSTTQTGVNAAAKAVHVISINPAIYITGPTTTLHVNAQTVTGYGLPSLASAAGTVVVSFKYSLNGAANTTVPISSTNSSGASFFSFSLTFLNGTNTLKIFGSDSNGNLGSASQTFSVTHVGFAQSVVISGTPAKATIGGFTGIKANYTNTWTTSQNLIVFAVWKNSLGQTVAVSTGGLTLAAGATGTAFAPLASALPSGTYSVNVFVWTTSNTSVSVTTTISVTV